VSSVLGGCSPSWKWVASFPLRRVGLADLVASDQGSRRLVAGRDLSSHGRKGACWRVPCWLVRGNPQEGPAPRGVSGLRGALPWSSAIEGFANHARQGIPENASGLRNSPDLNNH
jgi:hypothetical protein